METNVDHPSEAMLVLALDRELEPREIEAIHRHVEACESCREILDRYQRLSQGIVDYHRSMRVPRPQRRYASRYVAAAAAVLVLATSAWYLTRNDRPAPQARQLAAEVPPPAKPAAPALPVKQEVQHRRRYTQTVAATTPSFIALPFSDSALPLTDARVVRARIPVEELRLTGLTVEPAPAGALVEAEVLLGIDGLPRGIRFIQ